jgi:hypothetical protein
MKLGWAFFGLAVIVIANIIDRTILSKYTARWRTMASCEAELRDDL